MDLDLTDITGFLHSAAHSVGAEVTSPWLYLQLGLILAGGGIAFAAGAAVRSRVDLTARAASWPAPLRLFIQVLVDSTSLELLKGSQLDYVEEMVGASFQVKNPNATSSCGCGNSFSV